MADLSLDQQKDLENHKGYWGMVAHLQKVGYEVPITIIKTLLFMSGGAVIGVLTFLGNLWTRNDDLGRQVSKDMLPRDRLRYRQLAPYLHDARVEALLAD